MSDAYRELIDSTIQHLEDLKASGTRCVSVHPETLASLTAPASKPQARMTAPAPAPAAAATVIQKPALPKPVAPLIELVPVAPPKPAVLNAEAKAEAIADLRTRAMACVKCPNLASSRKNVVFGVGDINTELMFVGEAPGQDEDEQGEPFVGKAGQLLTKIIQTMGYSRSTVYIANILKCRPDTPGQTAGNRKPTPEEMKTCLPYLLAQIDLIQPRVIVALGGTAVEGLFGKGEGITKLRGRWKEFRGIPVMLTFHPSYLLRNMALSEKRKVWEDMLQVLERLGQPISEKQRGYFLKA